MGEGLPSCVGWRDVGHGGMAVAAQRHGSDHARMALEKTSY